MTASTSEEIYLDLRQACECLFDLTITNPKPLPLGLMNLKWKVETREGFFVLKQFNKERYERYDMEILRVEQEFALQEQGRQRLAGTPCPRVLMHAGRAIYLSSGGERFVVMEYIEGQNLLPGTLNTEQMYNLGRETAKMHRIMNDGFHDTSHTPKFVPPTITHRIRQWLDLASKSQGNSRLLQLIEEKIAATERFQLGFLESCRPGWAHRDLWVDNVLFHENEVAGILDFDRFAFDYPELDMARAIMSGALHGGDFNLPSALAFYEGYRAEKEVEKGTLVRSLRLLWYMESVWWVVPYADRTRYQEVQFENEMVWLAANLHDLPAMFGEL